MQMESDNHVSIRQNNIASIGKNVIDFFDG